MNCYADNDGTFPDETDVAVRYPLTADQDAGPSDDWPWLPGVILGQCGPDEWHVLIDADELATDKKPTGHADAMMWCGITDGDGNVMHWLPMCFRGASEIRRTEGTP